MQAETNSTFSLAAFVVGLQVEAGLAVTGVGPMGVQAGVFACGIWHFIALIDVHAGHSTGVQSETCSTVTPLRKEENETSRNELGANFKYKQKQNVVDMFLDTVKQM